MSRVPGSEWQPVAYQGLHARVPRGAMLLHTNGGGAELRGWWGQIAARGQRIGAQYQVFNSGRIVCYVDPSLVVYHAYGASEWAIGVETEDDGNPGTPWTAAQINSMALIGRYHHVPPRMLVGPGPGDGVGYHQQHTEWNQSGHGCPGSVRVAQIPQVLRRIAGAPVPPPAPAAYRYWRMLQQGNQGVDVQHMQRRLGVTADGIFGPQTAAALRAWQRAHGLVPDALFGPLSSQKLG